MQLKFMSINVSDQKKALAFYTEILGFKKMADFSNGDYRWLTVVSPDGIEGVELLLESLAFPPAKVYQKARFEAGIPATTLTTKDIKADFDRLAKNGVKFHREPINHGPTTSAVFEDTCGNLIHLVQYNS